MSKEKSYIRNDKTKQKMSRNKTNKTIKTYNRTRE